MTAWLISLAISVLIIGITFYLGMVFGRAIDHYHDHKDDWRHL